VLSVESFSAFHASSTVQASWQLAQDNDTMIRKMIRHCQDC